MIVVWVALFWLLGMVLASVSSLDLQAWAILTLTGLIGTALLGRRDDRAYLAFACLCALAAGATRYLYAQPVLDPTENDAHVAYYNDGLPVTVRGTVVREPEVRDRAINVTVDVDQIQLRDGTLREVDGLVLVSAFRFPLIEYGTELKLEGRLQTPFEDWAFSYKEFLAQEGIYSTMFLPQVEQGDFAGQPLRRDLLRFKDRARDTLYSVLTDPQASLLNAILLGDDNGMSDNLKDQFRFVGLSHLIVVSGFHVSILMVVFLAILDPLLGWRGAVFATIGLLIVYAALVGANTSVIRAVIMGTLYLIGTRLLGRPNSSLGALALAAIIMSLLDPLAPWNIGFQLSFMATLGLILFAGPLDRWATRQIRSAIESSALANLIAYPVRIVLVSLAAQLLTIPLVAYHFQQIPLLSLLSNLLVVWAQPLAMVIGGLAILCGFVSTALGQAIGFVASLFLGWTLWAVRLVAGFDFASIPVTINVYALLVLYGLIGGIAWYLMQDWARRREIHQGFRPNLSLKLGYAIALLALALTVLWSRGQPDGLLHVTFFDVNQGDAIFVQTPTGRQILIDAGFFPTIINEALGREMPFFDRSIDLVVATHPDADHVTGLPSIFNRYRIGQFITDGSGMGASDYYDAVLTQAAENEIPIHNAVAGEVIEIGDGVRLEVVHPGEQQLDTTRNDNSVSFRLVYGDFSLLLTGDAEEAGELDMLKRGEELRSIVYKAGHHGSRTSSTEPFLDMVQPQIAVVSAGLDNKFGHPHPEILQRFAERGISVVNTIDHGTLEVITDGETMWWEARETLRREQ